MYALPFCFLLLFFLADPPLAAPYDGPLYDFSAYTQCKTRAEGPLYNGGILKGARWDIPRVLADGVYSPAFVLRNLTTGTKYCFSSWVKIKGTDSAPIRASLMSEKKNNQLCRDGYC